MNKVFNRRRFIISALSGASVGLVAGPAMAQKTKVKYNFSSASFGGAARKPRVKYKGKRTVNYRTNEKPGTIIISTRKRRLYFILGNGKAIEYGVGVGRAGFQWSGVAHIGGKQEWPAWHPPAEMIEREKKKYGRTLPAVMEGGPNNPLGARALYLFQGNKDTLYRIHGTNNPASIGYAQSSGCIRMMNEEVIQLYRKVKKGTKVIVL